MFINKWTERSEEDRKYSCPGSPIKVVCEAKLDKNNNLTVVPKGEENLYAYINSFAESVDINVIMTRFMNGDKEILLQRAGAYLDISNLPNSFQELVDIRLAAQNVFDTLPYQVKEKFQNNINNFISTMGTDEWKEIMNTSEHQILKETDKQQREITKKLQAEVNHAQVIENPGVDEPVADDPKGKKGDIN